MGVSDAAIQIFCVFYFYFVCLSSLSFSCHFKQIPESYYIYTLITPTPSVSVSVLYMCLAMQNIISNNCKSESSKSVL